MKALETVGGIRGVREPNAFKFGGHLAFWIRKLKPFSLYKRNEMVEMLQGLGLDNAESIVPPSASPDPSGFHSTTINELIAITVACGLVEKYAPNNPQLNIDNYLMNDWVVGLRYHSYSPSSLGILLEGLAKK